MNTLQRYRAYLKNNPEGYWFKRKLYGWGWTPAKWQGWAVVLLYVAAVLTLAFSFDAKATDEQAILFLLVPVAVLTALLIGLCYVKGEKPRWQWGLDGIEEDQKKK